MESDKDKIIRLEEAYRKLWAEHEDLKIRIKENYAEFKVLRDQIGIEKPVVSTLSEAIPVSSEVTPKPVTATIPGSERPTPAPKKEKTSWEQFIGEQLLSKIGIAIVLIGVGIGAKYAIDHNLIGESGRVFAGFAVALVLGIFAFVFRTKYKSFSAVLASGAIGVAYFMTYAAYSFYQLIPSSVAFGGLLVLVLIAVFLAMYYNMAIIAHLGLIGAYILPPLVSDGSKHISYYLLYMLIINIGMLIISIVRKWPTIQYPVIIWTSAIFLIWFNTDFNFKADASIAASYLVAFFALFVFGIVGRNHWKKDELVGHQLVQLVLVGICYFGAIGFVLDKAPFWQTIACNLIGVGVYYLNKILFERENRLEFKRIFLALSLFGLSNLLTSFCGDYSYIYVMVTGVLLLFWLSKEIARNLEEIIGIILLGLATLCVLIEVFIQSFQKTELPYYQNELVITVGLAVIAMGITFALLSRYQPESHKNIAWKTAGIFALLFVLFVGCYALSVHMEYIRGTELKLNVADVKKSMEQYQRLNQFGDTMILWQYAWISLSVLGISIFRRLVLRRQENYSNGAMILGTVVLGISLLGFTGSISNVLSVSEGETYWNSFNLAHYALFAGVIGTVLSVRSYGKQEDWTKALALLMILWILSLELVQWSLVSGFGAGYKILLSVLWVFFAVVMIVIGIKRKQAIMRITAMVILGLTMLKMFFYDLSTLSTIYKTVVFIAIGGLLLVGAYFYQTLSKQEEVQNE
ncbi:MAG: Protein of unknown function transrane [Fluviicola sp.]|jgi:uncharacterized membrane protein|uniref:DUF2339 domain-containing protein n=1 Tax=Fluviicola sp. TaxID=1917219 RepID=UPI002625D79A|nr:DUF2339 domain-containing protein [Fluviicola sp.]MDF3027182.1 Protein of unknown function transrane [Fluviicola sp.]